MLALVAERARHATAAGVHIDDFAVRDAAEETQRRSRADQGLLMAVGMEKETTGLGDAGLLEVFMADRNVCPTGPLFKRDASLSHPPRNLLELAAEQPRMIVPNGRVAPWFHEHDRQPLLGVRQQRPRGELGL